jgi:hypothetical protein
MADEKITDLGAASRPLDGTEWAEVVQGGVNKKVAASDVGAAYGRAFGSGRYHLPDTFRPSNNATATTVPTGFVQAFPFSRTCRIDALCIEVTVAVAASTVRLSLYDSNSNGLPAGLIEAVEVSSATSGVKVGLLAAARDITRRVWIAHECSAAITVRVATIAVETGHLTLGMSDMTANVNRANASRAYGSAAADPFPSPSYQTGTGNIWVPFVRIA